VILRGDEQRLGARHTAANHRTGPSGLDALAHPGDDWRAAGNDQRLPESRWHRGTQSWAPERIKTKTGNFAAGGVHRLRALKTGHFRDGVDRLEASKTGHQGDGVDRPARAHASGPCADCERVRAVPRANCRGARAWPQRHGDLAGPRRSTRLPRAVRQRAPFCRRPARQPHAGSPRGDYHRARRRGPGGLRRRPDGPAPDERHVPAHAALRADAGLLAEIDSPAGVAVERADVGRAP
jgi:hypothetical protein